MNMLRVKESVAEAPVKKGDRWKVIVARPGQGSSANYSEDVLKRDAAIIVPEGAQSFLNHGVDRNPKDMIGTFSEGYWSEADKAVVADLKVFSHFTEFVDEVGPHCGMSLYAMGEADEEGNLVKFVEDVYNGADLVARPGLLGSGLAEKLYESAINTDSAKPSTGNASAQDRKDNKMEIKELGEKVDALTDSIKALVSAQETKVAEDAQVEADEKVAEERVEAYADAVEAIESARADLLPSQVKSLHAEAKKGGDISASIESAKALVAEMREDAKEKQEESAGRVIGGKVFESASDLGKVFG